MSSLSNGSTIRNSNPAGGFPHFSEKSVVTGAVSPATLPATLSGATPVAVSTATLTIVQVLEDEVTANTYQQANPTANVGFPVPA